MINYLFGGNDDEKNDDDSKSEDLGNPKFWEDLGIKPIVVDINDPDYIDKLGDEVCDRINEAVKELKRGSD